MRSLRTGLVAIALATCVGCGSDAPATSTPATSTPATSTPATEAAALVLSDDLLQQWLSEAITDYPNSPGHLMWVISPGYTGGAAVGTLELGGAQPMRVDTPIRIASVTKTFVAAAVLRLVELGRLKLDDPISRYVSPGLLDLLRGDRYDVDAITVRHLLTHRSGIADYAGSEENYEGKFQKLIEADPTFQWNRRLEVEFAVDNYDPLAKPGAEFHYSDTGYVLLGDLLEQVMDVPSYGAALSELLDFKGLGLTDTFVERLDRPAPSRPLAHQYIGTLDYTAIDPGQDMYGGGGIVSTAKELSVFFHALFGGRVFDDPATLQEMTTDNGDGEGMGIFIVPGPGAKPCYTHSGYGGIVAVTCPSIRSTVTLAVNQVEAPKPTFRDPINRTLQVLG